MSVPLGHKNHRSIRSTKPVSISSKFADTKQYQILDKNTVLSKDGKTLVYLNRELTGPYTVPRGVEIIAYGALGKPKVSSIKLPKSVRRISDGATNAGVWFHAQFDVVKSVHEIIGVAYTVFPRLLIFKDKELLSAVQKSIKRKHIPKPIKEILLDIHSASTVGEPTLYDKFGVEYEDDGRTLVSAPDSLDDYRIPDGVTSVILGFPSIKNVIIPESLKNVSGLHEYCPSVYSEVRRITFLGPDSVCTSTLNEKLERIEIPKGSRSHYEKQFPDFIDKIVEI